LSSLCLILAIFASDARVSSTLGGGMLFIDGPRGILSILALLFVASSRSCFVQGSEWSANRETTTIAWLIMVQSVIHRLMYALFSPATLKTLISTSGVREWLWILCCIGAGAAILKRCNWGRILYISSEVVFISWDYYTFITIGLNDGRLELEVALILHRIFFPVVAVLVLMRRSTSTYFNRTSKTSSAIAR
jgi:hypothetical protein